MSGGWAKQAAKSALPEPVQGWIRDHRPGSSRGPVAGALDRWAARRVLRAVLVHTDYLAGVQWAGRRTWQFPVDAWVLQEVVSSLRPDLIVELGTYMGGSAFYLATLLELLEIPGAEVMSIDVAARETITHPRITYVEGSSTDPTIVRRVEAKAVGARQVLVVLDSDHSADHVARELELYAPVVPVGGYLHVQDGWVDELGLRKAARPGPAVAARDFLRDNPGFVRDLEIERRYLLSLNPCGWLRRVEKDDGRGRPRSGPCSRSG